MPERMSRAEIVKRVGVKSYDLGDPARVLAEIGGPAAFDDLVDILRNEPEPPGLIAFDLHQNVIKLLGALGEERIIAPLLECNDLYRAAEDLLVAASEQDGTPAPLRYGLFDFTLVDLAKKTDVAKLRASPAYSRFREKMDRSHLRDYSLDLIAGLLGLGWVVRVNVVRALEKLPGEGKRAALTYIFEQEQNKSVRRAVAEALGRLGDCRGMDDLGQDLEEAASVGVLQPDDIKRRIDLLFGFGDPRARQWVRTFYNKCTDPSARDLRDYAGWRLGLNPEPKVEKSKCFIATVAYGSEDAPAVSQLRHFREERLRPYRAGRTAIALYEHLSPPLAEFIRSRPGLRAAARVLVLKPTLFALQLLPEKQSSVRPVQSRRTAGDAVSAPLSRRRPP